MANGKRRAGRQIVLAQAALVWSSFNVEEAERFIERGEFPESESDTEVLPAMPGLREAILKEGGWI